MIGAFVLQFFQFLLVLLLAPGLTGLVRKAKARLLKPPGSRPAAALSRPAAPAAVRRR
jgi:formate hydrogenlyase subunit 4